MLREVEEKQQQQQHSFAELFDLRLHVTELERSVADFEAELERREQTIIKQADELAKITEAGTQNRTYQSDLKNIENKRQQRTKDQRSGHQLVEIKQHYGMTSLTLASTSQVNTERQQQTRGNLIDPKNSKEPTPHKKKLLPVDHQELVEQKEVVDFDRAYLRGEIPFSAVSYDTTCNACGGSLDSCRC
jgi:hypothetical protein